jgi:hypothetical protein
MDRSRVIAHNAAMRVVLVLGFLSLLAACSGDPKSYGITGPGPQAAPVAPAVDQEQSNPVPGVSTSGSYYGPSNGPIKSNSGFFGYN